jgi:hypothetical protein
MDKATEALVQALMDAAKNHDWFHEYSDDHYVWSAGHCHRQRINKAFAALDIVDESLSVETWNRIAPEHFHFRPRAVR